MRRVVGPAVGFEIPVIDGYVIPIVNAFAFSVMELDHSHTSSGTTSSAVGSAASCLGRAAALTEAGAVGSKSHVVLQEDAIAGKRCRAIKVGPTTLVVGGAAEPGDYGVLGDSKDPAGKRIRFRVLEGGGVDGVLGRVRVWFDGEKGFGQVGEGGGGGGGPGDPPGGGDPGGGRPPGGFDPSSYNPGIAYSGTGVPPALGFGSLVEF